MPSDTNLDRAIYDLLSKQCPAMWLGIPIGAGNVFWVNTAAKGGSDLNVGTRPDQPFEHIQHALDNHCVDEHNDYIMVIDDYQEEATITVNKTCVHIIGLANYFRPNTNNPLVCLNASDDWPVFTVSALSNNCEIAGFMIGGGDNHAGIENPGGTPMGLHIHDCVFGHFFSHNDPQDGILIDLNATNIRIEHCVFLGPGGKGFLTRDGIRWSSGGDPLNGDIENNQFKGLPGVAIDFVSVAAATGGITIKDNVISCKEGAGIGNAITLEATCRGFLVVGNKAGYGGAAMGVNPYLDNSTVAPFNTWIENYTGNALIYPA